MSNLKNVKNKIKIINAITQGVMQQIDDKADIYADRIEKGYGIEGYTVYNKYIQILRKELIELSKLISRRI